MEPSTMDSDNFTNLVNSLQQINDVKQFRFQTNCDSNNLPMDCLDIFKHRSDESTYYGVYHSRDETIDNFRIYLAESKDGLNGWSNIVELVTGGSQAKIWVSQEHDDILLTHESHPGGVGNFVALKHYGSLGDLKKAQLKDELNIERSLGPVCEGTPSFEKVEFQGDLQKSLIKLRFHYYKDNVRDF